MAQTIPFSVILPVYHGDRALALEEALRSLAEQSLRAAEIVLIEDGPLHDALYQSIAKWQALLPELKRVALPVNQGLSGALNAGIQAAQYEWLARMDADDCCLPDRFAKQFERMEAEPELALLGTSIIEYDEALEKPRGERRLPLFHDDILRYARWRCPFNHMTVVYRKSVVQTLGGYRNFGAVGDDYELWARFLMGGYRVGNLAEPLVKARTGEAFFRRRRRGWRYFQHERREIEALYRTGLLNQGHRIFHLVVKFLVRMAPAALVKVVYRFLRRP